MNMGVRSIRIFPPLAVARLGSSPLPLENYDLEIPDAVSPRKIVPAMTLLVDEDGNVTKTKSAGSVAFRDSEGFIHPVAPFFELWTQMESSEEWVPLTKAMLEANGLEPSAVRWKVSVGNHKIFRRTNEPNDRIDAVTGEITDHRRHELLGECKNFLDNERLPLGFAQYLKPSDEYPEIRLRFTPAHGKVYGSASIEPDPFAVKALYDPNKGRWKGYQEPTNPNNDYDGRRLTNPAQIFAGYDTPSAADAQSHVGYGYVDDECDGIVEASLNVGQDTLTAFARVAAGPPTFAPDSKPIRTVADELEQALLGPKAMASHEEIEAVKDIVRRALETVRLMNTAQMNKAGKVRGVGMARMDILDYDRKSEQIFDPEVTDALAIRTRHERVLLALESGSLAWFARVLRDYEKVGDLTDDGRRKMPGMMRNADGRYLALTRRQVSKVKAMAEYIAASGAQEAPQEPAAGPPIRPINLPAQLEFRARGNPPNSQPDSAISNAYPGLEMDFRNVWRKILDGIVLHESLNFVLEAERPEFEPLKGMFLLRIAGIGVIAPVTGPDKNGIVGPLKDTTFGEDHMALEWSNALASLIHEHTGEEVDCDFETLDHKQQKTVKLKIRSFFEAGTAVIARDIAEPGALTQSLCAPWQNDYRECACFYWAASRPDFVNVEIRPNGSAAGNNWMQRDRTLTTPKVYINDDWMDERLLSHTELIKNWEGLLRFIIGNEDEPPVRP
jgi:hypothetical protein